MAKRKNVVESINEKEAELQKNIYEYESDTFSAKGSRITKLEAKEISRRVLVDVMNDLIDNQRSICYLDGVAIMQRLNELRHPEEYE